MAAGLCDSFFELIRQRGLIVEAMMSHISVCLSGSGHQLCFFVYEVM